MKIHSILFLGVALLAAPFSLSAQDKPEKSGESRFTPQPEAPIKDRANTDTNPSQLKIDKALNDIIAGFFLAVEKNQIDDAYQQLTKGSKIAEKADDVATLKKQTKRALDLFGAIQGYELVQIQPIGTRLQRVTCLSLGKDLPLRWKFYFYRAENDWKLIDIGVDDRLIDLFNENPAFPPASSRIGEPQQ